MDRQDTIQRHMAVNLHRQKSQLSGGAAVEAFQHLQRSGTLCFGC